MERVDVAAHPAMSLSVSSSLFDAKKPTDKAQTERQEQGKMTALS